MNSTTASPGLPGPGNPDSGPVPQAIVNRRVMVVRGAASSRNHERLAVYAHVTFIVLALLAFAYFAQVVVLPVLFALVVAMILKPPVRWLMRYRLPAVLAAALVTGVFVAAVSLAALYLGRPALAWVVTAPESLLRLRMKFQPVLQPAVNLEETAARMGLLVAEGDLAPKAVPIEINDHRMASSVVYWTGSLMAGIGQTLVLIFLLLVTGDAFMNRLVQLIPRLRDKKQAVNMGRAIEHSVSSYLLSLGMINVCLGVVVGLALQLVGMPDALVWGGVIACVNFIPYFGPVVGVVAVGIGGLLAFDTIGQGLLPAGIYFALHFIEANLITPQILGRSFMLNPVIIFVTLIFGLWLWGAGGALLAVPLLVTARIVCEHVPSLHGLGGLLGPDKAREGEPRMVRRPPIATPKVCENV